MGRQVFQPPMLAKEGIFDGEAAVADAADLTADGCRLEGQTDIVNQCGEVLLALVNAVDL